MNTKKLLLIPFAALGIFGLLLALVIGCGQEANKPKAPAPPHSPAAQSAPLTSPVPDKQPATSASAGADTTRPQAPEAAGAASNPVDGEQAESGLTSLHELVRMSIETQKQLLKAKFAQQNKDN